MSILTSRGLRSRGSLTVWISLTAGKLVNWDAPRPRRRQPGRQRKYSNHAIETAVTLGMVFHLSSRQSEGLLRSLFALMKLDNDVPDHTTISRRKPKLGKVPFYQVKQKTPLHILLDSSGLAVHAGQLRRAQKSRDYRKLHLCVDEQSGEVVAGELTSKRARDSSRVASLVGQSDSPISSARADTGASSKLLRPRNQGLTLRLNSGPKTAKLRRYAQRCCLPRLTWRPCHSGDVSAPRRPGVGERRFAAASDGAEERAPTPTARRHGTGFLGCPSSSCAKTQPF